jgi:DNA-binding CsgD family transcriptional regulator
MESIYSDSIITIEHYKNIHTLSGRWNKCKNPSHYLSGIKCFKQAFDDIQPKNTFWDNQRFNFELDEELQSWTNTFFYNQITREGFNGKVGVIVGDNLLSSIAIDKLLNSGQNQLKLRFFKEKEIALDWLSKPFKNANIHALPDVFFKNKASGKIEISLEIDQKEFHDYFLLMKQLFNNRAFNIKNAEKYFRLTERERDVLKVVTAGLNNLEISKVLFISIETVKTHRKNILAKLNCKNSCELTNYEAFY